MADRYLRYGAEPAAAAVVEVVCANIFHAGHAAARTDRTGRRSADVCDEFYGMASDTCKNASETRSRNAPRCSENRDCSADMAS
jgi:hypothetical protein